MVESCRYIILAMVDALLFLETAGDNEVDPDSAVRCMETMASSLLVMQESDQLALRRELDEIADGSADSCYRVFVRSVADSIGLASTLGAE